MSNTILITGFEPFGENSVNPSQEAVRNLPDRISSCSIYKSILPVTFAGSFSLLRKTIETVAPAAVICTGLAGNRNCISIERVAINIADTRRPDNDGDSPLDQPLEIDGPDAYFSTLPIRSLYNKLAEGNFPVEISNSAGTYVCNATMYRLLHYVSDTRNPIPAGFIHLPTPSEAFTLENITDALHIILKTVAESISEDTPGKRCP